MLIVRGGSSRIVEALRPYITPGGNWISAGIHPEDMRFVPRNELAPVDADRYLFCQGFLAGRRIGDQSKEEIAEAFHVNAAITMCECDHILDCNPIARICIIGSESGYSWSHDSAYAGSKAAIHHYVENKRLGHPGQQIVCIAPGIITNAGMTLRRDDQSSLARRKKLHPKGRFANCDEVARLIYYLLYLDTGYTTNVVIRMTGGEHVQQRS